MSAPTEQRCQAIIKYARDWRCERYAKIDGLCLQHYRFGARVPAEWHHEVNDLGVLLCKPVGPVDKRRPAVQETAAS